MIVTLLALAPPLLASWLLLRAVWPTTHARCPAALVLQAFLAAGMALGLSSCVWLGKLVGFSAAPRSPVLIAESAIYLLVATVGGALLWRRWRRSPDAAPRERALGEPTSRPQPRGVTWMLLALFGAGLLVRVGELLARLHLWPHGMGDAWFTWNMRARFLYRGGTHWRDAFSNSIGEAVGDYPLLVPLSIARLWTYAGQEGTLAPSLVAAVFTLGAVGLLVAGLAALRGMGQAAAGGLALLSTPFFFQLGASQVADVPLAFFVLGTMVLYALHDALSEPDWRLAAAAGMLAGLAAWTKNDGAVFLVSVAVVRAFVVLWDHGPRVYLREAAAFVAGAAPVLAVVLYFKLQLAPEPNYLVGEQTWGMMLDRLGDPGRYIQIGAIFLMRVAQIAGGLALFLPVYGWLLGAANDARRNLAGPAALTAVLVLCGYAAVYLITPRDLPMQLLSSLHRLLMHVWPLALFSFFLAIKTPEEALTRLTGKFTTVSQGRER